jgi:glycosyltransferase involved in cell wall biosynthesis
VKVLILHHHFNTPQKGGAIRSYYLAKALVDRGVDTVVITTYNGDKELTENVEGIYVHYLPIAYDNKFGFYKRARSFLQYIVRAVRAAAKHRDADLCYTISVPLTIGLASLWIKRKYKIPYAFEVGDLWPDAPIQLGFIKNRLLGKMLFLLEETIYNKAQSLVALSPAIESSIRKKITGKDVYLIPNMSDTDFFRSEKKNPLLESKFEVNQKFVISYIGALGFANGLDYFLECADASRKANLPIHFLLCGEGAMKEKLKQTTERLHLVNLSFVPFQNRDGVKDVLNVTDAVFICYRPVSILESGSPNKYFDGLAAGKLIIINFDGWIRKEIETEECGFAVNAKDSSTFTSMIAPYLEDSQRLKRSQERSRALAEKKYSRKLLSEKFSSSIIKDRGK